MKKKYLSAALAFIMAAGMLSGCGSDPAPTASSSEAAKPAESTAEPAASAADETAAKKFDDVKLKMLICWNGGFKTAKEQGNNTVANAIRDKIGVTVEFEQIMMSEAEKLNLMFASGDMPDIVNAPYWGGNTGETAIIKKAAAEGRLADISKEVPKYANIADAYDIGVISKSYLEKDIDLPEYNGARYVLPQEVAGDVADIQHWAYGVFVRGDVPKALGIDETQIKTTEQLYDFMVKARDYGFKDVNGNACIVATTYHEGWGIDDFLTNFDQKKLTGSGDGGQNSYIINDDKTVEYEPLTDHWIDRNLFVWKMVKEGILDKECFKHNDDQAKEKSGNGTVLFTTAQYGVTIDATKLTGLYTSNPEMRYTPVGPLNYADGSPLVQIESEGRSGSPVIFFPSTSTNLDAALTYIDYCNSREGLQLIKYGVEGDTCVINDQGQPRLREDLLQRKLAGDALLDQELRDQGINYMQGRVLCADKSVTWFGEKGVGDADAELPEMTAYKKARPIEVLPGYSIAKVASEYENYDTLKAFLFEGTKNKDYRERAYFADTEEEARAILVEFQEYVRTQENGMIQDYLNFLSERVKADSDIVD